ncbi:MAG TPA: hypothetical protein VND54_03070 [Candidatus Saccharimonadales bacterium]|nr:hypothetical protein [Candidatus Saccharimonadales bacterium]
MSAKILALPAELRRSVTWDANNALWRIVMVRLTRDQRTTTYVSPRTAEGMAKRDIVRCLKRYVAREVFPALLATTPALTRISA